MRTLLLTHPAFQRHETGPLHPERPARMRAIDAVLAEPAFAALQREEAPLRDDVEAAILLAHSYAYLEHIRAVSADRDHLPMQIDLDTVVSAGTWKAALLAVCAALHAVDAVMDPASDVANAFCQVRPPGHHAERERAMGFCLFSTVAIAGLYARARHGAWRVAVIDFDVHHGNGTQGAFWTDADMFYGSTHQMPLFPGTGAISERGVGNICNAPLRAGDDGAVFRAVFEGRILPALESFGPDLILISAGFDAHRDDPLADLRLLEPDFTWVTDRIVDAAQRHCSGRVVSFLEGGYQLDALARSTAAHVEALMRGAG
jgi:acetoin utilization deacetylase AcuC-like enzyme